MKKLFIALSLLVLSLAAAPQSELDRAAAATAGMEADFTHSFKPKGFTRPQNEHGAVIFGKLPAMRWTYTSPESKTFVFDGAQSWFYVPSDKQVIVTTITDQTRSELPFLALGDAATREKYFTISEQGHGATNMVSLTQKRPVSLIHTVNIETDAVTHRINSIDYTDRDGNKTVFVFSKYRPAKIDGGTFTFAAPQGVQVVRGD
ncbi:MAG TPA: outer membrane lipoprotein chaperone LolA [Thermoanaerobaculia bacterium]|nr:outer membrane lipoprotein chaperone LolA [Thermoanaerobaculia bacterium]